VKKEIETGEIGVALIKDLKDFNDLLVSP